MKLNDDIDKEALRASINEISGWNFMCLPEATDEIDRYCETGDFESLSPLALHELNGIYRYVAWGYEWRTGKHLPNIFQVEEEVEMDYAKFVKNYYRYATKTIKKYREGSHSMCDKFLNPPIPNIPLVFIDEDASVEYSSTMSFKLIKEDAPTEFIIEFMSFYSSFHPGLLPIYTHEEDIKALFDKAKKLGFLEDDEKMMKYIELVVESYAKALEEQYILEPRKRRNNYDR